MTAWAFLGSGEFEPWHDEVDAALLADRTGRVLVVATASAPEGEATYEGWRRKGLAHFGRGDRPVCAPELRARADAHDPEVVALLDDAALVFFSGGNPAFLASTLVDTPFWTLLRERVEEGQTAFAGCSAGAAFLSDPTFDSAAEMDSSVWAPGVGYFPGTLFAPHWDTVEAWRPGAQAFIVDSINQGGRLVAIDEDTAMVGDGADWRIHGRSAVHVYRREAEAGWQHHPAGASLHLALPRVT